MEQSPAPHTPARRSACNMFRVLTFYGSKICCNILHGMEVSWSRAPCSPHCLHRCTTFHLHFILHYNHLQVTQEEHKHPEQRSPESGGGFGRLAEQFSVTGHEPTRSLFLTLLETFTRSPLQEGQVFAGTLVNQSKLGKNLTKVWLRHCSRKTENQVMSTGESLTLEKKALCTKQPGYGET